MKRFILLIAILGTASMMSAQFMANTLEVISTDSTKFTLRVGGSRINKEPLTKVVVPKIYADKVNILIEFEDSTKAPIRVNDLPIVRFHKKKDNIPPCPYKAKYLVTAKKNRSKIKVKSITQRL